MSRRGWVLFALMGVIWGIPFLLIKVAVEGVSVPVVVFARTAIGAAILLPLALRGRSAGGSMRAGLVAGLRPYWKPLLAFATIEMIVPWWLLSDAERHISSSMAGLVIGAVPVLAVVMSRLFGDREGLSAVRGTGLAVGFAGVAVLVSPELGNGEPVAIVEMLLVALCYATAPLIAARWLNEVPALPMTAVCLGFAAVLYTPAAVVTWPDVRPSGQVLAALAALAVICTAIAFIVFFALIREVGATRALVFTYVNPAVAVTAGVIVLGEPLTTAIVASFVLIIVGSVLATARPASSDRSGAKSARQPVSASVECR
ncbi:MAG TPA: DMT family transporter [Actinomycetes bacterium]|nr:DMT family transporter [Actinomycetes bacterium]